LSRRRPHRCAADSKTEGLRFQRRSAWEEDVSEQEDDFEVMADPTTAPTSTLPTGCTLDDFCSYAPSRCCIYLPCKTMSAERQCR